MKDAPADRLARSRRSHPTSYAVEDTLRAAVGHATAAAALAFAALGLLAIWGPHWPGRPW